MVESCGLKMSGSHSIHLVVESIGENELIQ